MFSQCRAGAADPVDGASEVMNGPHRPDGKEHWFIKNIDEEKVLKQCVLCDVGRPVHTERISHSGHMK